MISKIQWKKLIFYVVITLIFGFVGSFLGGNTNIYKTLVLPPLSPPPQVFGIVWTILYVIIGISAYLIAVSSYEQNKKEMALNVYFLQLAINSLWSLFFFRFNLYLFSFVWILLLFIISFLNLLLFYRINKKAGLMFVPYLVWLLFAGYLNFGIYLLN